MSQRRSRKRVAAVAHSVEAMPISARVAWAYLATVFAGVAAGVLGVVADQSLTLLICSGAADEEASLTCKISSALWISLVAFLLCLLPAVRLVKLDWWLWLTMVALAGLLVATDQVLAWWWWVAAALLPAAAALLSADWERGESFRRWQRVTLLGLVAVAVAALLWWYLQG